MPHSDAGWRMEPPVSVPIAHGASAVEATQRAFGMIAQMVQQQSQALAYIDVFKVMAIIFFAVIPLLVLVKRSKPGEVALGH